MSSGIESRTARLPYGMALIVEDDINTAEYLQEILGIWGCCAAIAQTGSDALQIARCIRPELVICDLQLPDMLGSIIARNLRRDARTTKTRLVALSGYSDDEHRSEALNAGFDSFLAKPIRLEALFQHLRAATYPDTTAQTAGELCPERN